MSTQSWKIFSRYCFPYRNGMQRLIYLSMTFFKVDCLTSELKKWTIRKHQFCELAPYVESSSTLLTEKGSDVFMLIRHKYPCSCRGGGREGVSIFTTCGWRLRVDCTSFLSLPIYDTSNLALFIVCVASLACSFLVNTATLRYSHRSGSTLFLLNPVVGNWRK